MSTITVSSEILNFEYSMHNLRASSAAFRRGDISEGLKKFRGVYPAFQYKVYEQLWIDRNKPSGNSEYGRHAFNNSYGLHSNSLEKAKAIDRYLEASRNRCLNTFSKDIHQNIEARDLLKGAAEDFSIGDEKNAYLKFGFCITQISREHALLTYFFLSRIQQHPKGDTEYGMNAFWKLNRKTSTVSERIHAINATLTLIHEHEAMTLHARQEAAKGNHPILDWWEENKTTVFTVAAIGGTVVAGIGAIFLFARGGEVREPMFPLVKDGHIVVGGGHMDTFVQQFAMRLNEFPQIAERSIVVGGGHMDSIVQQVVSRFPNAIQDRVVKSGLFALKQVNFDGEKIVLVENPTVTELFDRDHYNERQQLESILERDRQAKWLHENEGVLYDPKKVIKELNDLAEQLGKSSRDKLLQGIFDSIAAGIAFEACPPLGIYEGYKAVESFKEFGTFSVEEQRLRDLADRWGK